MSDLDVAEQPTARTVVGSRLKCRHRWMQELIDEGGIHATGRVVCVFCGKTRDESRSRRGRQSRNYGNRAELDVARRYGGQKIGHAGGPVDVRGAEWNVQVKTHRRNPPAEWTVAFAKMAASTDRLPRLLLRFVRPGNAPEDYFVVPAKAWLDWHGKDE